MESAILVLFLSGTAPQARLNIDFDSMAACQQVAERERTRGHKAYCLRSGPYAMAR